MASPSGHERVLWVHARMFARPLGPRLRRALSYTERMKLLAMDCSTDRLCLALCVGGDVSCHEQQGGAQAGSALLPRASDLLQGAGLGWSDLDGLAYGLGPGAFTGLRGACAAAQGLALGLGIEAVAVPSLRIVAEDARAQAVALGLLTESQPCHVRVAMDARMGQVYAGAGSWDGRHWRALEPAAVLFPREAARAWSVALGEDRGPDPVGPTLLAGCGVALFPPEDLAALCRAGSTWIQFQANRSAALARCARELWLTGPRLDAAQMVPLYVRDDVALTLAQRQARAAAVQGQRP